MRTFLASLAICLWTFGASAQVGQIPAWPPIQNASPPVTCTAATNYLARTSGGNEGGNATNITALICGLVTDGVITGTLSGATGGCGTYLDTLYILAQQNATDAVLNLCGTSYGITTNGATFTSYTGYSSFGGSGMDTGFNSTTASGPVYTQNAGSFGFWSYAIVNENAPQMGTSANGTTGESNIYNHYTDGNFYGRVNSGSAGGNTSPNAKGEYVAERTSSSNVNLYWDGVLQAGESSTSASPENIDFNIGRPPNSIGDTNQTLCEAHIGATMGATLQLALYNRLRTYMTAVGVP